MIIKLTYESAAIGLDTSSLVEVGEPDDGLDTKVVALAQRYMQPITVQEFIVGREVTVPILETPERCIPGLVGWQVQDEEQPPNFFHTFESENISHAHKAVPFHPMDDSQRDIICATALAAFHAIGFTALARIDLRLDSERGPLVIDLNESPTLTRKSSFMTALFNLDFGYPDALATVIGVNLAKTGSLP